MRAKGANKSSANGLKKEKEGIEEKSGGLQRQRTIAISSRIDAHHQFLTSYFYVTHPTPLTPLPYPTFHALTKPL